VRRLSFEEYVSLVCHALRRPLPEPALPSLTLVGDLGLDSFDALELLVLTEDWAGLVCGQEVPELTSVGDAYDYYLRALLEAERSEGVVGPFAREPQ